MGAPGNWKPMTQKIHQAPMDGGFDHIAYIAHYPVPATASRWDGYDSFVWMAALNNANIGA